MRLPSVSVIIPAYNAAAFVARAVDSALRQSCATAEVLVIDDESTDETADIAGGYGPPVRLLRQAHAGPGAARNLGAREAAGEWLAFLDADDAWLPHKLERQMPFGADPAVDVVYTLRGKRPVPLEASFEALWGGNFIVNSSTLVRRSSFWAFGGFDEDPALIGCEDWNLWLRMAAGG